MVDVLNINAGVSGEKPSGAKAMSIYEYDQEEHIRLEREDAFEDGRKVGLQAGRKELIGKIMKKGLSASEIADMLEEDVGVVAAIIKKIEKE